MSDVYENKGFFGNGRYMLIYWLKENTYHSEKHYETKKELDKDINILLSGKPLRLGDYGEEQFPIRFLGSFQIFPTYALDRNKIIIKEVINDNNSNRT